ncbi:MAG: methyltransferase domain-containing protein, partial [Aeromicrobium sp.]
MTIWDPNRYLRYADERSRPFVDLVTRVQGEPRSIVDLGCGPGHLTAVLRDRWPEATVLGVDSSVEMIERARAEDADPLASYELADVSTWEPPAPVDLIVSNALFQWVPDRLDVIERLAGQ